MPEKLRCAVIGAGAIGLDHLKNLASCPQAATVAVAEIDPKRCRYAADQFRIPRVYRDYQELLEQPDIDAVTVALPNCLHLPVGLAALEARKHLLIEKPIAMSAKEALKLIETARKMKRTFMVGQNYRFNRHTQIAKETLQRGEIGEVYHAHGFWLRRAGIPRIGSWFTQKRYAGGGCMYDLGVHMLDLCLHLMGDFDVRSVSAQTFSKLGPAGVGEFQWGLSDIDPAKPFDVEDFGVALIRFRSGRTLLLQASWAAHHPTPMREHGVDLLGTKGGISLFPAKLFRDGTGGYQTIELSAAKVPHAEDRVQHFVQCVLQGKKPLVLPEESLKVQQILDAISISAATGKEFVFRSA